MRAGPARPAAARPGRSRIRVGPAQVGEVDVGRREPALADPVAFAAAHGRQHERTAAFEKAEDVGQAAPPDRLALRHGLDAEAGDQQVVAFGPVLAQRLGLSGVGREKVMTFLVRLSLASTSVGPGRATPSHWRT